MASVVEPDCSLGAMPSHPWLLLSNLELDAGAKRCWKVLDTGAMTPWEMMLKTPAKWTLLA